MNGQITVSRSELLNKLTAVGKVLSSKSLIPAHGHFLFEIKDGVLTVTGADAEGNITRNVEAVSRDLGDCKFSIGHKILLDGLKVLPEQPLTFDLDFERIHALIKHESGVYDIPMANADDFTLLENRDKEPPQIIELESNILVEGIKQVYGFAGNDEIRPIMSSVLVECEGTKLNFVATNSSMMAVYEQYGLELPSFKIVLPVKIAKIIADLASGTDTIRLEISSRNVKATFGDTEVIYRLIEGNYPNYRVVIPKSNDKEMVADTRGFIGALKRTSVFTNKNSLLISLDIDSGKLTVRGKDIDFQQSAEENLPVTYNSPALAIGFKSEFILKCLEAISTDEVKVRLKDHTTAALLSPAEKSDSAALTILIMPMMINV